MQDLRLRVYLQAGWSDAPTSIPRYDPQRKKMTSSLQNPKP